ncbi:MAG: hypothetical protein ACFFB3_03280 [Candidatus Hodarchaeota archaeon]
MQLSWTFYCATIFDFVDFDYEKAESLSTETNKKILVSKNGKEGAISQTKTSNNDKSYPGSGNANQYLENPQAGKDRVVSGKIGTLEDPLDPVIEDYVDNQDSDMDSLQDKGDLTDFPALQAADSTYANLSEVDLNANTDSADCTGGYFQVGVGGNTDFGSTSGTISLWLKWDSLTGRFWGQDADFEVRFSGAGNANLTFDWGSDWTFTYTHGFTTIDKWYFWAVTWNETNNDIYVFEGDETTVPSQVAYNDSWIDTVSTIGVTENTIMNSRAGSYAVDGHIDDFRYWDTDRSLSALQNDYDTVLTGSESNLVHYYKFDNDLGDSAGSTALVSSGSFSFSTDTPSNFDPSWQFDHEVQFTGAAHFLPNETLCIKTGSSSGSEGLNVTVWNGTAWSLVASDLSASEWNNYSISINSTTLTIKFGADKVSNDFTQSYWLIDAVLLRLNGTGTNETYVMNNTSNIDSSPDIGQIDSFSNMQDIAQDVATLTEDLEERTMWIFEDDTSSGYVSTSSYVTLEFWSAFATNSSYSGLASKIGFYVFAAPGNSPEVKLGIYDDDNGFPNNLLAETATTTIPQSVGWLDLDLSQAVSISPSTTYHLAHITNTAPANQWRYRKIATPVSHYKTYGGWPDLDNPAGSVSTSSQSRYGAYRLGETVSNYQLDQEVQWTDIPHQLHGEYLCIQTGSINVENLDVEIWNGSDWVNVISGLNANAWNNVSVHSYLNSTTFTIRFIDSIQSSDNNQDSWEIDAVILHFWAGKLTKLSVPLLIYGGQMYNLSSIYPAPQINFTDSFTIRVNYTAADDSSIPGGANPAVRVSSTLTQVSQVLMTDHENGTFTITLSTMANVTGEYFLSIAGTATNYQPRDDEPRVFMIKANPTELIAYSHANESIVDTVYYHPAQNHPFYLQWNDSNHNVGIDATTVEINSSKVVQVDNGTLGGHSFEFLPNVIGIDALSTIKIVLSQEGYESLTYTVTFDVQVTPTVWSSFGPMNGTAAYYDKTITLWMVWNDSPHIESISGGILAHNGSIQVSSVQEINGNYSLVWHLNYTNRLPLPQTWVLNVTLSQHGYENRSLLFEISLQKSPTAGVAEYSSGATIWLSYTDQYTFWVQWQDSDGVYGSSTPVWINDTDDPHLNDSFVTYLKEDSDPALGNYTFIFNENGMLLPGLYIIGITFANATHGDTLYELQLFIDYTPTGAGECSYVNGSTVQVAYNDSLEFFIRWQDLNHSEWLMAVGYIERGDLELVSQLPNGNHSFRFNSARNKAIGNYPYIIILNKTGSYGYEAFAYHITFIVIENPTAITDWLSKPSNETVVTLGKTYDFWLLWADLNHSTLIAGASVTITGNGSSNIQELTHSGGTYSFRFEASQQAFFEANISLSLAGYKFTSHTFNFTVLFLHTAIVDFSVMNTTTINLHYADTYQMWLVWNDTDNDEWMEDPSPEFSDTVHVNLMGIPSAGNHTFQFNATDLGFFAVTITLEVPGYEACHFILNFQITSNPTAISESRYDPDTTVYIRYSDSHEFWLVWQDTYHLVMANDDAAAITGSETTQLALIEPGNHTFRFIGLSVGSFAVTITLEATGYDPASFRLFFVVEANPTTFADTSPAPYSIELIPFGSLYDFFVLWEDMNHSLAISGAFLINNETNFVVVSSATGGYYTFTFNASKLSSFGINITLTKTGYESISFLFTIVVIPSPTTIHSSSIPYNTTVWLYYGDSYAFWTRWQDVTTLEFITDNNPYSFGSGSDYMEFLDAPPGSGNHTFKFAGSAIGTYFVTLTFGLDDPEHASTTIFIWFDVQPRPTENVMSEIAFPNSTTVETIIVAQYAWRDHTSLPVSGASVLLYWNGTIAENASFIEVSNGIYNVSVDTGEAPWGFHNLTLWFRKYGFINQTVGIDITIIGLAAKLEILIPHLLVRGEDYVIETYLYRNNGQFLLQTTGTPILNQPILFLVAVIFDNGTAHDFSGTIRTTDRGIATFVISHRETKNIISVQGIWAWYDGNDTYMGTDSTVPPENIPKVEYRSQAIPLTEQLWDFIQENLLYIIVSSLILLILVAISGYQIRSYQKTRKHHYEINQSLQEIRLLRMVIIRHKHGVDLFSKSFFGADELLPQAISGMSAAFASFMEGISTGRIEGTGDASSLGSPEFVRMEQRGLHLLQRNGPHTAVIVISEGSLGKFTEKNITDLQLEIEQRFEAEFERFFTNRQIPEDQLGDLVDQYLYASLLGPIQVNEAQVDLKLSFLKPIERRILRELRAQQELVPNEILFIDSYIAHLQDRGISKAIATQFLLKGYRNGLFGPLSSEEGIPQQLSSIIHEEQS